MFQALLNVNSHFHFWGGGGCVMEQIVGEKYVIIFGYLNDLGFQRLN